MKQSTRLLQQGGEAAPLPRSLESAKANTELLGDVATGGSTGAKAPLTAAGDEVAGAKMGADPAPSPGNRPRASRTTGTTGGGSSVVHAISSTSDIVSQIRGVLPKVDEIADAIDAGVISVNRIGDADFNAMFTAAAKAKGRVPSAQEVAETGGFHLGQDIYLRGGSSPEYLLRATIHEGVHVLDELRGMKAGEAAWEVRAYMEEYLFSLKKGIPTFSSVESLMAHIQSQYGIGRGWSRPR